MRGAPFRLSLLSAGLFALACGARTGDDELFGYDDGVGIGGSGTGGVAATGGRPFVGGGTSTGGASTGGGGAGGTGGSSGGSFGACCSEHLELGCNDPFVADCVCNSGPNPDPFCCTNSWDSNCVVGASACGACGSTGGTTSTGGASSGGGVGTGGATSTGGSVSTGGATSTGGSVSTGGSSNSGGFGGIIGIGGSNSGGAGGVGGTGGSGAGGSGGSGGSTNSCCVNNDEPQCNDPDVEECVCSFDSYCCTNAWDTQCAQEATSCGASCPISGPNQCDAPTSLCSQCLCESCIGPFTSCSVGQNCAGLVLCSFLAGCACF